MNSVLTILQHALGRDEYGRRKPGIEVDYRNHFCTGPGSDDWDICEEAVRVGLMTKHPPRVISGGDWIFLVTAKGVSHVSAHSPPPPKLTKGQLRYEAYLSSSFADNGGRFGEWLKDCSR